MVLGNKGRLKGDALRNLKARHEYRQEKEKKKKKTARKAYLHYLIVSVYSSAVVALRRFLKYLDINRFVTLTWHELRLR